MRPKPLMKTLTVILMRSSNDPVKKRGLFASPLPIPALFGAKSR
jgi:hypothetical protein